MIMLRRYFATSCSLGSLYEAKRWGKNPTCSVSRLFKRRRMFRLEYGLIVSSRPGVNLEHELRNRYGSLRIIQSPLGPRTRAQEFDVSSHRLARGGRLHCVPCNCARGEQTVP